MTAPYYVDEALALYHGDALDVLRTLPSGSVDCCVTSTGLAAVRHGRRYVGIDLNREYLDLSLRTRLAQSQLSDGAV